MDEFKKLFGISAGQITKDVIITPVLPLRMFYEPKKGNSSTYKGVLYEVFQCNDFTVIKTFMGAGFVGDAVLHLENTICENLYFLGSCGAIADLQIADIILADTAYEYESFTQMLKIAGKSSNASRVKSKAAQITNGSPQIIDNFLLHADNGKIKMAVCASVGSLKLETIFLSKFKKIGISAADMELSGFYSAAAHINRNAMGLLYVSDFIDRVCFYDILPRAQKIKIQDAKRKAVGFICSFIREKQKDCEKANLL